MLNIDIEQITTHIMQITLYKITVHESTMGTHKILADETISVSELRKNPGQYFTDHAIAVLSNNRLTGYVIGAEAYEALVALLMQNQVTEHFTGRFRPTAAHMKTIAQKGAELLANASEEELGECSE